MLDALSLFSHIKQTLRLDKAIFFSPLLQSNFSVSLNITTWGLEVLLFSEFINIVSIFYTCIDLIVIIYFFGDSLGLTQ